jgi:hypothetical protein
MQSQDLKPNGQDDMTWILIALIALYLFDKIIAPQAIDLGWRIMAETLEKPIPIDDGYPPNDKDL